MTIRMIAINNIATSGFAGPTDAATAQYRRYYTAAASSYVDVPGDASGDAAEIASNAPVTTFNGTNSLATGLLAVGTSGATSARPQNPRLGALHVDTTLGYTVIYDGSNWRNPISGAAV